MEWLHHSCDSDLSADFLNFGASDFPLKILLKKVLQNHRTFWLRRVDPVLELQFLAPLLEEASVCKSPCVCVCAKASVKASLCKSLLGVTASVCKSFAV